MAEHQDRDRKPAGHKPADAAPDEIIGSRHGKHGGSDESEGSPQEHDGSPASPRQSSDTHAQQSEAAPRGKTDRIGG